jgi:glycerol-3-phosphate dehydrogenase
VIGSDKSKDPSKERRNHAVWVDEGLVTVTGGKLTTFRKIALDALAAATATLGELTITEPDEAVFRTTSTRAADIGLADESRARRLAGRYGAAVTRLFEGVAASEREKIGGTGFCLAECRWAARNESVLHLDDLLLRRTRLGSLLPGGGEEIFSALETICAEELQWDRARWEAELARYREIWERHYYLPAPAAG